MYIKMNETLGRPITHYELGDLLVSDFYKGEFLLTGVGTYDGSFSFLCIDGDNIIPVEIDLRACPKGMFKPYMESTGFYK